MRDWMRDWHDDLDWIRERQKADKAETLVRELVGVIDDLRRQINECGLDDEMWEVYERAKEVLGDEETCAGRQSASAKNY